MPGRDLKKRGDMDSDVVDSRLKSVNIAKVTQKLIGLILAMPAEERLGLLQKLEEEKAAAEQLILDLEQRRSPRIPYTTEVDFVVENIPYKGLILDISEEGARIVSCDIPVSGAEVRMAFQLPGRRNAHVCLVGHVVRDTEKEFGVCFNKGLNQSLQRYDMKILGPCCKKDPE